MPTQLRSAHLAEVECNRGVVWRENLVAVARDEQSAGERGIRRRADKLQLPASAEAGLLAQEGSHGGLPLFFELTAPSGARTHAVRPKRSSVTLSALALTSRSSPLTGAPPCKTQGVLSFTAQPGTVALPPHTARCLASASAPEEPYAGPLRVRYTRLPKGTFAKLQPLWAAFQRDVPDIKLALEALLATHCTLTVGDTLLLNDQQGAVHALRVTELQPEDAVCVIETDLEVYVEVSLEAAAEQAARARAEAAVAARAQAAAHAAADALAARKESQAASEAAAQARRAAAVDALEHRACLEPPPGAANAVHVALRLPGGERLQRSFDAEVAPLATLFYWADSLPGVLGACVDGRGDYRLVAAFPRRVIHRPTDGEEGLSLRAAGFTPGAQELLNLESAIAVAMDEASQ